MVFLSSSVRKIRRAFAWLGLAGIGLLASPGMAAPSNQPAPEYQIKAAFLFNFAQFVEWPASSFPDAAAPLIIGILGDDPYGAYLDELVKGEKIGTRPLVVQRYRRIEDIAECHILFVSKSVAAQFDKMATNLNARHMLTVGDSDSFSRQGGIVRFVTEAGKIRLRINAETAKKSEITISSKLLRVATIVTAEKG